MTPEARATCEDCSWSREGDLVEVSDAAEEHEPFHAVNIERVATDGGLPTTPGCWVLEPTDDGEWHVSVEFDGYDHTTGCGETLRAPDDIAEVVMDQPDVADTIECCTDCLDHVDAEHDPRLMADGAGDLPYADLEHELRELTRTATDRLRAKEDEYGPDGYVGTDPEAHSTRADVHLEEFGAAVESYDLDAARVEAADVLNHVLMALCNIERHAKRADGGFAAQPEPEPESATDDLASAVRDHPPGKPHHCTICDTYHATIVGLVDHACDEHDDDDVATDGGEPAGAIDNSFADAEQPALHVGDHVTDRDDDGTTMLVTGLPGETAEDWVVGDGPETVADHNEDYPATDEVVQVVYPQRTDAALEGLPTYSFPRSRVERQEPIHDVEGGEDGE